MFVFRVLRLAGERYFNGYVDSACWCCTLVAGVADDIRFEALLRSCFSLAHSVHATYDTILCYLLMLLGITFVNIIIKVMNPVVLLHSTIV